MAARLVLVLSVFTLGMWSHVTASMQMTSDDDVSEVSAPRGDGTVDLSSLFRLEQYLYDVRNKLEGARQVYDRPEDGLRAQPEVEYQVVPNTKRKAPVSGFYSARGRRTEGTMTSQDAQSEGQGRGQGNLLRLLEYYQALHEKRTAVGEYMAPEMKRQPPRGFHAVRGRRSSSP